MSRAQPSQTLFLPELPSDITDGVLERHFRGFVGYESCRTRNDRNGKLVGFVEFESIEDASRARESMQGASPFPGVNWHIHFSTNPARDRAPKRARDDAGQPRHDAMRGPPVMDGRTGLMGPPQMMAPYGGPPRSPPRSAGSHLGHMGPPPPSYGSAPPMSGHMGPPPPHGGGPASHQGHSGQGGHNYGYGGPPPYEAPPLPHDASPTLYVEGLPADATEREVAHIFRRFEGQGYQSIRMFPKEGKNGSQLFLCFVEFDHPHAANHAMQTTQGYRFDRKSEASALKISFSRPKAPDCPR